MTGTDAAGEGVQLPFPGIIDVDESRLDLPFESVCVDTESAYSEAMNRLDRADRLVADVETTGLGLFRGDRICGVSVFLGGTGYYFPFRHMGEGAYGNLPIRYLAELTDLILENGREVVGHNIKFDLQAFHQDGARLPTSLDCKVRDTMLAAHLLNENERSFNLEKLAHKYRKYIDVEDPKQGQRFLTEVLMAHGLGKGGMWKLPAEKVAPYGNMDTFLTDRLDLFFRRHLRDWDLYEIWEEVCLYSAIIADCEIFGVRVDLPLVEQYRDEAVRRRDAKEEILHDFAGYPCNPRSAPQMQAILGVPTTDKRYLQENHGDSEVVQALIEYRSWDKMRGTYYDPFLEQADEDGDIHSNMLIHGTISGRMAVRQPPLQAIPRKDEEDKPEHEKIKKVKDVFIARPGYVLASLDYAQAEVRLATHYSRDVRMREVLLAGQDIHSEAARDMGIPRHAAKRLNFSVIYGIGAETLADNLGISVKKAREYLDAYHSKRPGFRKLYKKAEARANHNGHIRMWTGRVRHYNHPHAEEHKASSNLIQGGVAELIRVAMTRVHREFRPEGVRQLLQVHDSDLMEIPEDRVDELLPEIVGVMQDFDFDVPMLVDAKVGKRWGTAKER